VAATTAATINRWQQKIATGGRVATGNKQQQAALTEAVMTVLTTLQSVVTAIARAKINF